MSSLPPPPRAAPSAAKEFPKEETRRRRAPGFARRAPAAPEDASEGAGPTDGDYAPRAGATDKLSLAELALIVFFTNLGLRDLLSLPRFNRRAGAAPWCILWTCYDPDVKNVKPPRRESRPRLREHFLCAARGPRVLPNIRSKFWRNPGPRTGGRFSHTQAPADNRTNESNRCIKWLKYHMWKSFGVRDGSIATKLLILDIYPLKMKVRRQSLASCPVGFVMS